MSEPDIDFTATLGSAARGDVLKPILMAKLYSPDFTGFTIKVEGWSGRRWDGKFHPSTHATWTLRQLYLYLTRPDLLDGERMDVTGVLAVTAGTFWHTFIQRILLDAGPLLRAEVPVCDEEINLVGHADGELSTGELLELKTYNNEFTIQKIDNEVTLRERKPEYYAQTQDYLAGLGREAMRYLVIYPTYPFHMTEFVVKANLPFQTAQREKYLRAYELAQTFPDGSVVEFTQPVLAPACCAPGSVQAKGCPVRLACPVGRFSR